MNDLTAKPCPRLSVFLWLICSFVWLGVGCQPNDPSELQPKSVAEDEVEVELSVPDPLTVLIIESPEVGEQIERQWRARRDGELTVKQLSAGEWHGSNYSTEADVVLYPPGLLPDLAVGGRLLSVPDHVWDSKEVQRRDILKRSRQVGEYDGQIWGLPLASPQWMLMYRADLLEQAKVEVPITWDEWFEAIKTLREADLPIATDERVVLPLADNWAAHAFLVRCAAMVRQRGKLSSVFDRSDMTPLIDQDPFVEALRDLKRTFGESKVSFTPAEAWSRLLNGKCVMAIAWPMSLVSEDSSFTPNDESNVSESISIASVPGSSKWFDLQAGEWFERDGSEEQTSVDYMGFAGLVGSVSRETRHASSAFEFLQWLSSSPISSTVLNGSQQSGPFRKSQLKSALRWSGSRLTPTAGESMADQVRAAHNNSVAFVFPRVPGYLDYVQSLDRHVRRCLAGKSRAEESLKSVADEWEAITERIGAAEQTANLRRGDGL
jgi:multiple sugar transport system substrate-binding protein